MLKSLLPAGVAVHEEAIAGIAGPLWPQEQALCAGAVDKRRREFTAGRVLARRALAELGAPESPLLTVPAGRAPLWPDGFIGSISHTADYAAAAAARRSQLAGIGLDIEAWSRFHESLEPRILTAAEVGRELGGRAGQDRQVATAVLFSAKESFYKLQHPLTAAWVGFDEAEVELDWAGGLFRLSCRAAPGPFRAGRVFDGRFAVAGERVATAVWLDA